MTGERNLAITEIEKNCAITEAITFTSSTIPSTSGIAIQNANNCIFNINIANK